jgi:hypothetical protein
VSYNGKTLAFLMAATVGCSTVSGAETASPVTPQAYAGMGAVYVSADRTESYEFLEKIARYRYLYPRHRLPGQKFPPDLIDLVPNAIVRNCSDAEYRCLTWDTQAFAVPQKPLAPNDKYVAAGNKFSVTRCVRGTADVCQVALIKAECYIVLGKCSANADGKAGSRWELHFIYNEDFGVVAFEIQPPRDTNGHNEQYILSGNHGLLGP